MLGDIDVRRRKDRGYHGRLETSLRLGLSSNSRICVCNFHVTVELLPVPYHNTLVETTPVTKLRLRLVPKLRLRLVPLQLTATCYCMHHEHT